MAATLSLGAGVAPHNLDITALTTRLAELRDNVEPAFKELVGLPVAAGV